MKFNLTKPLLTVGALTALLAAAYATSSVPTSFQVSQQSALHTSNTIFEVEDAVQGVRFDVVRDASGGQLTFLVSGFVPTDPTSLTNPFKVQSASLTITTLGIAQTFRLAKIGGVWVTQVPAATVFSPRKKDVIVTALGSDRYGKSTWTTGATVSF